MKHQKTIALFFLSILLIISTLSAAALEKKIRVMLFEWEPYAGSTMPDNGFTADIVITAFQNAGYKVEYDFFPWRRCLVNLERGEWDVLINMYYTEERAKRYLYPDNHISTSMYTFFALKSRTDIPDFITREDLDKFKIGLVKKASYGAKFDAIKEALPNTYTGSLSEKNLLQMLLRHRVDIVPSDIQSGWFSLKKNVPKWQSVRTVDSDLFESKKLFPLFTKKNPSHTQFVRDWDTSMENMIKDGSLNTLHKKHDAVMNR